MKRYDDIVIGAGTNGLAAAALLAQRGRRVLVLEQRDASGGTNATEELHPGFRVNVARDDPGWIPEPLSRACGLGSRLTIRRAPMGLVAVGDHQLPLPLSPDPKEASDALRASSAMDAARWPDFAGLVHDAAKVLASVYRIAPSRVPGASLRDLLPMLGVGRKLRSLGRRGMMEVLRALPMPIGELLDEWFETPVLKGALATLGVHDLMQGPLASGTAFCLFHGHVGRQPGGIGVRQVLAGGTGALATALASTATQAGAEVRHGAAVAAVSMRNDACRGVRLDSGEEIEATNVLSSLDPRRTFGLVDPVWLDPALVAAIDHVRMRGSTARVHFALAALPGFPGITGSTAPPWLAGTLVLSGTTMQLERACDEARFGEVPAEPAMTATVPSLLDPTMAPPGRHVVSASVHHVPYALHGGWDGAAREALGGLVEERLTRLAPDFREHVLERLVLAPPDLEARFGVTEGSLAHGEIALDQALFMRPVAQCARYATPVPGLWLCGAGTHPASHGGASGMLAARALLSSRVR